MKLRHLSLGIPALLAACQSQQNFQSEQELLKVFLQGTSSEALTRLVEGQGGVVTHDLRLINGVGASMSRAQLNAIKDSPLVDRYIDDLKLNPLDEEKPENESASCDVDGDLELELADSRLSWTLYNKRPGRAQLQRLTFSWPAELGIISGLSLAGTSLPVESTDLTQRGHLQLQFEESGAPTLDTSGEVEITLQRIESAAAPRNYLQNEIELKVEFYGNCSATLIPGYPDNHEDFYYSSVVGADNLHKLGVTGKGVNVAVLDSGLWEHPSISRDSKNSDRIIATYDAILDQTGEELFDESGHGTHIASVIAHSGPVTKSGQPTGSFKGIAPDVGLVAIKALDRAGQGDFLDLVRALQWIVEHREEHNIRVLNLSFAARPRWPYWLDPVNQAVMRAWASGIVVVAAAGNEGPEPMTIGSPGNLPYIITVGAVTDSWTAENTDDDYIPDFSSRGPTPSAHIKPDIVAPGGHVSGVTRSGSTLTQEHPEYILSTGELIMTGSSQAAAVVSGISALLLQLHPGLSPDDIKCKLLSSAEPAINTDGLYAYSPFQQGAGYVNAARAVTLGLEGCGNPGLDISADIAGTTHYRGPATTDNDGNHSLPGWTQLVSATPSEKGLSANRRWGVKAHIERASTVANGSAIDPAANSKWMQVYQAEKAAIESLASKPMP